MEASFDFLGGEELAAHGQAFGQAGEFGDLLPETEKIFVVRAGTIFDGEPSMASDGKGGRSMAELFTD